MLLSLFSIERHVSTAQKMKFSINDFFSKCDQIRRKLNELIWVYINFSDIFVKLEGVLVGLWLLFSVVSPLSWCNISILKNIKSLL